MKHLQHQDETSETFEIYSYNMRFQCASHLVARTNRRARRRRMELAGAPLGEDLLGGPSEHLRTKENLRGCLDHKTEN